MSQTVKEFYKILGVEKNATQDEIKKSYRKLSKILHPDVNTAVDAKERFQELHEAYQVLSDDELRKQYDEFVTSNAASRMVFDYEFQGVFDMFFAKKRSNVKPINGEDIKVVVPFLITEVIRNETKTLHLKKKRVCDECNGQSFSKTSKSTCSECSGVGYFPKQTNTPFGKITTSEDCQSCKGTGHSNPKACEKCESSGVLPDDVKFELKIPKGVTHGSVKVFKGEGQPGLNGGKNGALVVTFSHQEYDRFKIEYEYDVVRTVKVGLKEALAGGKIEIVFPDGTEQEVDVHKGVRTGERISVPECGLFNPSRKQYGSFNIEFAVDIPTDLSEQQINNIIRVLEMKGGDK